MGRLFFILIVVVAIGAYFHFSAPADKAQAIKQLPSPENPDPGSYAKIMKDAKDLSKQAEERLQQQVKQMEALENQ